MSSDPLVTIWCTVYNHKDYIDDAIQGFLNQRTNFEYEILIHDDCSTDGSTEILRDYERRYPDLIHVLYEKENVFQKEAALPKEERKEYRRQVREGYRANMRGKYLAICEGDDFWIDSNKLQIQVSYMEAHPECLLTGTNGLQLDCRNNKMVPMSGFDKEQDVSMEEILLHKKMNFPTASIVMVKELFFRPSPYFECRIGDWIWQIRAALDGKVHYFDRITAVYRYLHSGSWSVRTYENEENYITHMLDMVRFFDQFNQMTNNRYEQKIQVMVDGYYNSAAMHFLMLNPKDDRTTLEAMYEKLLFDDSQYGEKLLMLKKEAEKEKEEIEAFSSNYNTLYIMGAGDGAHVLNQRLQQWEIDIKGFVVSDGQPLKGEFDGKTVVHLSDLDKSENFGIVIGIQKKLKSEIEQALYEADVKNYIWASV